MHLLSRRKARMADIIATSMVADGLMNGTAYAYQDHMFNSLHALQAARQQLVLAITNRGGYPD